MNVKKVLAGVLATAVAVSATAATALSASAADTVLKTFKFGSKNYEGTSTYSYSLKSSLAGAAGAAIVGVTGSDSLLFQTTATTPAAQVVSNVKLVVKGEAAKAAFTDTVELVKDATVTDGSKWILATNANTGDKNTLISKQFTSVTSIELLFDVKLTASKAKKDAPDVKITATTTNTDPVAAAFTAAVNGKTVDGASDVALKRADGEYTVTGADNKGGIWVFGSNLKADFNNVIGDKSGILVRVNFGYEDDAEDGDDYYNDGEFAWGDFTTTGSQAKLAVNPGYLKATDAVKWDAKSITFNWDSAVKDLRGNITDVQMQLPLANGDKVVIKSIEILQAEAATTTEAPAVVTDPATTTAAGTKDPSANPKTGAVALALVPVALAAAGLAISKKK